ncbi:UNVERIFIED_CONTAM: hypothetical protein RMT77_005303 [Armadillidium vulgare]
MVANKEEPSSKENSEEKDNVAEDSMDDDPSATSTLKRSKEVSNDDAADDDNDNLKLVDKTTIDAEKSESSILNSDLSELHTDGPSNILCVPGVSVSSSGIDGIISISPDDPKSESKILSRDSGSSLDQDPQDTRILNIGLANLETIKEGEILEIPPENQTPILGEPTLRSQIFFADSQSELAEDEDGSLYHKFTPRATGPVPEEEDEDNASVLSLPAELPPPPDGGWGWMIVFVSFLANLIVDGVAYSFSPFLDTFSTYFEEPKGKVAWISSLLAGMYLSVGPIVSALTNKYGCRPVCIAGAVIASLAYASTVFATSVPYLMVTQGCIAGFGFGLIYLPAVVAVGYYFESKRALATGIAVCGSGVGTMIFPPLVNILIENFGWQGTNLIIAGIILNCCWMGALMRPLEVPKMKKKDLLHRLAEEKKLAMEAGSFYGSNYMNSDGTVVRKRVVNYDPGVHSHLNLSGYLTPAGTSLALPTIQEGDKNSGSGDQQKSNSNIPKEDDKDSLVDNSSVKGTVVSPSDTQKMPRNSSQPSMNKNGVQVPKRASVPNFERRMSRLDMVNQMKVVPATPEASYTNLRSLASQDGRRTSVGRVFSASSFGDPETVALRQRRSSKDKKGVMLPPMSRQDIFYSGSIKNLNEFKSQASMLSYRESTFNLQNTSASRAVLEAFDGGDDQMSDESEDKKCFPDDLCSPFREMMDFSLLKNPCFLVVGIANMIGMLGFYTPFVYLPGAAIEKGIDKDSATLLVSIIGITNTIGRVLSGLIADIPKVDPLWVNNLSIIFSGVCMFLTPFANSFGAFVAIAVFFGFFVSAYISLTSIILVDLLGLCSLTNAFGLLILFRGSASLVGPPIAGSIYDATKSYDVSFYVSGVLLFICALLHCLIPCIQKFCSCHEGPVRYTTNEEYLQAIPEEELENIVESNSPDAGEGAGIMFDIKPKRSMRDRQERGSFSSVESKEKSGRGDNLANV